jgi:hypothetical protein
MNPGPFSRALSLAVVAFLVGGQVSVPDQRRYSNIDYEFSVRIPLGYRGCMTEAPNPNHGFWIPLVVSWTCADADHGVPYVGVFANYNVPYEAAAPSEAAAIECRWRAARNIVWLRGEISGRRAAGCRRDFPDGHVEVTLMVLRKTEPWRARWIEIDIDLITTPERYAADMRTYRQVLRGIWVHPDGPIR